MPTFNQILTHFQEEYDFNQRLGTLTKANVILALGKHLDNDLLKADLKLCDNLTQMVNTINQQSDVLNLDRSDQALDKFQEQIQRLVKFAKLKAI